MNALEYIADTYRVPAKKGQRVTYTGAKEPRSGVIVGARGAYLTVRFDGDAKAHSAPFHPTWEIEYQT